MISNQRSLPAGCRGVVRASVCGAVVLTAAQEVDIRLTRRPSSDTLLRALDALPRHAAHGNLPRAVAGYAAQSTLAPLAAIAATLVNGRPTVRFGAALPSVLGVTGLLDPLLGAARPPWLWSRYDWTRELIINSVLATTIVVVTGLPTVLRHEAGPGTPTSEYMT